ncbi:hypothetical protein [Streptomyces scabiei]|uniref:hypothetical protein n=1 Tax=Streptomyces scabiei TaxID=1930 RepID=UPI001B33CE36|nr:MULTISPECIES: hypothetical protein [Streptomyces]MDX3298648.1 hypothetical protein [Streptomyces scabiei]
MPNGTDNPPAEPTPIVDDLNAPATTVLERAAVDYAGSADVRYTIAQQHGWDH